MQPTLQLSIFFFFNDTATTEIYTLSLHDALPISYLPNVSPEVSANSTVAPASIVRVPRTESRPCTACGDSASVHVSLAVIDKVWLVECGPAGSPQPSVSTAAQDVSVVRIREVYTATRRAEPQEEGARRCCHCRMQGGPPKRRARDTPVASTPHGAAPAPTNSAEPRVPTPANAVRRLHPESAGHEDAACCAGRRAGGGVSLRQAVQ